MSPTEAADLLRPGFGGGAAGGNGGAGDAAKAFEDVIKHITTVIEANLTPLEKYRNSVAALDMLFASGALSTMDYDREVARLGGELDTTTASLLEATKAATAAQVAIERPKLDIIQIPLDAFDATLAAIKARVQPMAVNLGKAISDGLSGGLGNFASTLGAALGKGENVWKSFVGGIKALLGQMMVNIGQSLIATATAKIAFDALLAFSPVAALAIGIGLVAAGTALSGGGAGYGGGGATGGGGYYQPVTSSASQGNLTVVLPGGPWVLDPSDPRQVDTFVNMLEQASGRNVIVQRRA